jgi:hypothetical protein
VYSFLNDITGGLFGDIFSGAPPYDYQNVQFNSSTNQLEAPVNPLGSKNTTAALREGVQSLTNAYLSTFNSIVASIGTVDPASFSAPNNLDGNAYIAYVSNNKYWGANDFQVCRTEL